MKNKSVLLFAGTTEGRELASFLQTLQVKLTIYVATEYGANLLKDYSSNVHTGRLQQEQMEALLETERYDIVIDATHPFAQVVTENIQAACDKVGIQYLRILRPSKHDSTVYCVNSLDEAVTYLESTQGNVLLTTGSKTLQPFTKLTNYKERLFVRLLPMAENINKCRELGFTGSHLIAMQGPFSKELNQALLTHANARYLVTKDSGDIGGVEEKIQACMACDVQIVLIKRPTDEKGYFLEESKVYLRQLLREEG